MCLNLVQPSYCLCVCVCVCVCVFVWKNIVESKVAENDPTTTQNCLILLDKILYGGKGRGVYKENEKLAGIGDAEIFIFGII